MAKQNRSRIEDGPGPEIDGPLFIESDIAAPEADAATFEGTQWDVTIIGAKPDGSNVVTIGGEEFIRSNNNRLYSISGLQESAPTWDGVRVYDNHLTPEQYRKTGGMRSPNREWLGTIKGTYWDAAAKAVKGVLKVVDNALATKLKNAWAQDVLDSVGLSIDARPMAKRHAKLEGRSMPIIDGFLDKLSVDFISKPAAGGGFNRILASDQQQMEEIYMDVLEKIKAALKDNPNLTEILLENPEWFKAVRDNPDWLKELQPPQAEPETQAQPEPAPAAQAEPAPAAQPEPAMAQESVLDRRVAALESQLRITEALNKAKLSASGEKIVTAALSGRVVESDEINRLIDTVKESEAQRDPTGQIDINPAARISVGSNERDKLDRSFLQLVMWNSDFRALEHTEESMVKERIQESYRAWIKDGRPANSYRSLSELAYDVLGGYYFTDDRAQEASTTSSLSSIVKNALNVMIAADYAKRHRWWEPIVRTEELATIQNATLVRTYGMDTLDVVDEGDAYTELAWADEEETAAFVKKGNYAGVTMEAILKDNLNAIRNIPGRLSASWFNTVSKLVSGVFTVNSAAGPVLTDTGALFNATAATTAGGHANLLTTAFGTTTTAYAAARLAMRKQTDQVLGAGERLGITPRYALGPYDLEVAMQVVLNSEVIPGSGNNDINPFFRESTVIGVPHWTDANDWALVADPAEFPAIWLMFLQGQAAPRIFTASDDTQGAMFTNDVLRYKVQMLTWRFSSTYDCAPVSDFRPLHKNNVT